LTNNKTCAIIKIQRRGRYLKEKEIIKMLVNKSFIIECIEATGMCVNFNREEAMEKSPEYLEWLLDRCVACIDYRDKK
jgi:hypothetical protein